MVWHNSALSSQLCVLFGDRTGLMDPDVRAHSCAGSWKWHPANAKARLGYWHRPPVGATGSGWRPAIVVLHGIGIGGDPYAFTLSRNTEAANFLQNAVEDCHIFCPELPQLSYRIAPGRPLTANQVVAAIREMLAKHTGKVGGVGQQPPSAVGAAIFIGQSFGTAVIAWVLKQAPDLVYACMFQDPICFLLHSPSLAANFFYREPQNLSEWGMRAGFG
eukprot:SAG31_NODE_13830_length_843_cov_1.733871_1_plen_217_part_01